MRRIGIILVILVTLGLAVGAGYWGFVSGQPPTTGPSAPQTISVSRCDVQQTVTAPGNLVNARILELEMPFAGRLAEVLVRAGDAVSAGQVLARLADEETYVAAVASAELELAQAQSALSDLQADAPLAAAQAQLAVAEAQQELTQAQRSLAALFSPNQTYYQQQVARAQDDLDIAVINASFTDLASAVRQAQEALTEAASALEDVKGLEATYPGGFTEQVKQAQHYYDSALENLQNVILQYEQAQISNTNAIEDTQAELAEAQRALASAQAQPNTTQVMLDEAEVAVAQAQLAQAQAAWQILQNGPDPLEVRERQAQVDSAAAALAEAQRTLEQIEIKAPFTGVILGADGRVGETIAAATSLFMLVDLQALEVIANVTEEDYPLLAVGQGAEVFFDARPDLTAEGQVDRIIPQRLQGDSPRYQIYLTLSEVPDRLADGMTADTAITIAERLEVLCLPRAVVRASGGNTVIIKVWDGVQELEKEITIGLRGDTYIEIISGLSEGEQVVTR